MHRSLKLLFKCDRKISRHLHNNKPLLYYNCEALTTVYHQKLMFTKS